MNHLLHCQVTTKLWSTFFQLFGVVWVMPRTMSELLVSWRGQLEHRTVLKMWRLATLCLMWCLWRKRNTRNFEDRETVTLELKKMMFQSLYTWRVAWNNLSISNFSEFLDFCYSVLTLGGFFVYFMCARIAPLCAFNEFALLIKK